MIAKHTDNTDITCFVLNWSGETGRRRDGALIDARVLPGAKLMMPGQKMG